MEFRFKKGFIPKYYKDLEFKSLGKKIKKYLCLLFIANMISAPITISKINEIQDETNKKPKETSVINKPITIKNVKTLNTERLIYITSTMKEHLLEIKYENEKIFFKGKFKSQEEGEKLISEIKASLKKSFSYSSKLLEDAYIFNVSEE